MKCKIKDLKKPSHHQREILTRRQLNPANYLVIKDTYRSLYLWDIQRGKIKLITKHK